MVHEEEGDQAKVNADRGTSPSYNEQNDGVILTRSTTANTRSSILLFDNNKDNASNDRKVESCAMLNFTFIIESYFSIYNYTKQFI